MNVEPIILSGTNVRLEPLAITHLEPLCQVGLKPELWSLSPTAVATVDDMHSYILTALEEMSRGVSLPFVIIDQPSNQVIGSTRYGNIDTINRRLEIGWTWLTPSYQKTAANTEAKFLLLTHGFESLKMIRIEFKTDVLNEKSRKAITRLGATEEGIFRNHMIIKPSGRVRDTVYFSIIDAEWPAIKMKLENLQQIRSSASNTIVT